MNLGSTSIMYKYWCSWVLVFIHSISFHLLFHNLHNNIFVSICSTNYWNWIQQSTWTATAAQWLLNHGTDPFVVDKAGRTALHLSLLGGHAALTRLLVYFDADRGNYFKVKDCRGATPAQLLGATPGVKSEGFVTIWEAARKGDIDKIRAAIRNGSD